MSKSYDRLTRFFADYPKHPLRAMLLFEIHQAVDAPEDLARWLNDVAISTWASSEKDLLKPKDIRRAFAKPHKPWPHKLVQSVLSALAKLNLLDDSNWFTRERMMRNVSFQAVLDKCGGADEIRLIYVWDDHSLFHKVTEHDWALMTKGELYIPLPLHHAVIRSRAEPKSAPRICPRTPPVKSAFSQLDTAVADYLTSDRSAEVKQQDLLSVFLPALTRAYANNELRMLAVLSDVLDRHIHHVNWTEAINKCNTVEDMKEMTYVMSRLIGGSDGNVEAYAHFADRFSEISSKG